MHPTCTHPKITVTTDGTGVVSHAGSRLLADLADATTFTDELAEVLAVEGRRRAHDPGRVLVDMAIAVADGATTISDVAVLEHQPALFGPVTSDSTCWRLLDRIDTAALTGIARVRAAARALAWDQHAETHGRAFPTSVGGGPRAGGPGDRLDASLVICHSEKEQAAPTSKGTFGITRCWRSATTSGSSSQRSSPRQRRREHRRRPHHVLDAALTQIPEAHRYGTPILIRTDTAGCAKGFLAHIRGLTETGVNCGFSVGWAVNARERDAIAALPPTVWADAVDADGALRDGAALAEITALLPRKSSRTTRPGRG